MPAVAQTKGIVIRNPAANLDNNTATVLCRSTNSRTFGYHFFRRFDLLMTRVEFKRGPWAERRVDYLRMSFVSVVCPRLRVARGLRARNAREHKQRYQHLCRRLRQTNSGMHGERILP